VITGESGSEGVRRPYVNLRLQGYPWAGVLGKLSFDVLPPVATPTLPETAPPLCTRTAAEHADLLAVGRITVC
jgi:hypothetical protein